MRKMRLDVRSSGLRATFHLTLALKWFVNLLAYFYIFKFSLCYVCRNALYIYVLPTGDIPARRHFACSLNSFI